MFKRWNINKSRGETITITWLIETRHLHAYNYGIGITIWSHEKVCTISFEDENEILSNFNVHKITRIEYNFFLSLLFS